jgi:type VI secretion system secreted protein VgrG
MTMPLRNLSIRVSSGDALDVRSFAVRERMSALFEITVDALCDNANIDFDAVAGRPASFRMHGGLPADAPFREWTGLCEHVQQIGVEETGLSTYRLTLVPALWLLTQRRNHRMFQQLSELDIARKILGEWGIEPVLRIAGAYKKRKYRVQYAESDFAFLCRMLEDAGISFYFEQGDPETRLVLSDAPQASAPRANGLPFKDHPTASWDREMATEVRVGRRVRPGRYTLRDHDARLPASYKLLASAEIPSPGVEGRLERFHYAPGAFLFGTDQGESTPHADDKGKTRTDEKEGGALARKRLEAKRAGASACSFATNVVDLAPGAVVRILDHPRADLSDGEALLVVAASHEGTSDGKWTHRAEARRADAPYRPALKTRKPKVSGVESATVVGSAGEEIHTDEFGRVRVHFHWDRESGMDDSSSCWIPVSQPWGGAGYGGSNLPRVGQEVLVDFLGGDPDRPVIVGRLYTNLQKTPYKLPENKTQSGWKSNSTNGTGGYNELMFEDAAGRELVRMQAEKDLQKLVKHDETVTIGHDRTKLVQNDDAITVGNDRTKIIKNDESSVIGNDRTKLVQANERHVVGANRTRTVGANESVSIGASHRVAVGADQAVEIATHHGLRVGANQDVDVGGDHSTSVAGSHSTSVGGSQSTQVGGAQTTTVALASAETVGAVKALTVGGAYEITVAGLMNTTVMALQTESVGLTKTVKVGKKLEMVCGKAKVVLEAEGKITWEIEGGAKIALDNKDVKITAGGGGTVTIVGGPIVDINPPS